MTRAILVAHGSPADPAPQEAAMMALAVRVAMWLPGWQVRGATLAAPNALETAVAALPDAIIYPFFMAEGWFTRTTLPKRLTAAGASGARQLPCFGHEAAMTDLLRSEALQAARAAGLQPARTILLLAAHGSKVSPASKQITEAQAQALAKMSDFAELRCGYVEEAPFLAEAARDLAPAICLPFFALRAGHVAQDVPEALRQAGFTGPLMPAIGESAGVARLIAQSLARSL